MSMNKLVTFSGNYRGIPWEIKNKHDLDGRSCWTAYVNLYAPYFPSGHDFKSPQYAFAYKVFDGKKDMFELSFDGMHCGCTYVHREFVPSNVGLLDTAWGLNIQKSLKVTLGWDYNHCGDEFRMWNEDRIYEDVKETIDSILEEYGAPIQKWDSNAKQWKEVIK